MVGRLHHARVRFTADQFEQMARAGFFRAYDDRVELIDGEVVLIAELGYRHARCVNTLSEEFVVRFRHVALVSVQNTVRLSAYEMPQPDVALLRRLPGLYSEGNPTVDDVILLVEVGDSTAARDRRDKIPQYGRTGVPELWLVDLERDTVTVCREPNPTGYNILRTLRRRDHVAPLAFSDQETEVSAILGNAP